ncbi:MAG: DNA methyltransferase [Cytophagales bacterium]|nr:DNA methyltransferase [Cytophagales bacterium]
MSSNIPNRSIFCHDNMEVLEGINSSCIDLIYLDPPFNKKKTFTASIGSHAEGAEFEDIFREKDVKEEWLKTIQEDHPDLHVFLDGVRAIEGKTSYNFCYLAYMAIRLLEMHRILKDTGSIYLHCDPTMSHYLKILMDMIFGEKNFRNEIVWHYPSMSAARKDFPRKHDIIFRYVKSSKNMFNWSDVLVPYKPSSIHRAKYGKGGFGKNATNEGNYLSKDGKIPDTVWEIPHIKSKHESLGYPTQKPLKLLERIIKASSKEGDWVLDPFCGCATTCVGAEKLKRKWIGIDVTIKAYNLVKHRLAKETESKELRKSIALFWEGKINYRTSPPERSDQGVDYREQKYIYVISHPKYPGEYKVGVAQDTEARLNQYQTSDPNREYKIEDTYLSPRFRKLEDHIHEVFPNKHEWVQGSLEDIIAEIRGADKDGF